MKGMITTKGGDVVNHKALKRTLPIGFAAVWPVRANHHYSTTMNHFVNIKKAGPKVQQDCVSGRKPRT